MTTLAYFTSLHKILESTFLLFQSVLFFSFFLFRQCSYGQDDISTPCQFKDHTELLNPGVSRSPIL